MSPGPFPFVAVAVPTRNRAGLLATCLEALLSQDYPPDRFEIIVADDGSRDDTATVVEAAAARAVMEVRRLALPHRGPNAARNAALRATRADPVCFVDDDVVAPPNWLSSLVAGTIRHPAAGCVGGPIRLHLEGPAPRGCGRDALGESELDLGGGSQEVRYVWGANMAVRRHALARAGLFQEHRIPGHDEVEWMDRLHQAGIAVVYLGDAPVWHRRRADDLKLARMVRRRFVRGVGESVAYHQAGFAYPMPAQLSLLGEELRHAAGDRCSIGLLQAAQALGRLAGWAPLRAADRLRGRRDPLPPPPG